MMTLIKTRNKIPSSAGDGVGTGSTAHRIAIRKIDRVKWTNEEWNMLIYMLFFFRWFVCGYTPIRQCHCFETDDQKLRDGVEWESGIIRWSGVQIYCVIFSLIPWIPCTCYSYPCYGKQGVIKNKTEFLILVWSSVPFGIVTIVWKIPPDYFWPFDRGMVQKF